jgi:hypothetical protein
VRWNPGRVGVPLGVPVPGIVCGMSAIGAGGVEEGTNPNWPFVVGIRELLCGWLNCELGKFMYDICPLSGVIWGRLTGVWEGPGVAIDRPGVCDPALGDGICGW